MPNHQAPQHQSGGLAVALSKLDLDALTVADAVADVANMAGENVTTAIRANIKELRADMNARIDTTNARIDTTNGRIDTLAAAVQSLQREITTSHQSLQQQMISSHQSLGRIITIGFSIISLLVVLLATFGAFPGG